MIRSIPILNTARLRLAGMRPEDFDRYASIWADPDVVRFIGGRPKTRGESWSVPPTEAVVSLSLKMRSMDPARVVPCIMRALFRSRNR